MTTFTIDSENNITAFTSPQEAQAAGIAGAEYFSSEEELAQLAAAWPVTGTRGRGSSKLRELWNSLPGVPPVKKFPDRQTALAKIWQAAQALTPPGGAPAAHGAPKPKGSKKKATPAKKAAPARKGAKKARKGGGKEARDGSKKADAPEAGGDAPGDHEGHQLASSHGPGLCQRDTDQETGPQSRVLPQRGQRADLPGSRVAFHATLSAGAA